MIFNSIPFVIFAAVFFLLYFNVYGRVRTWLILIAGYFFYGWWDWRFLSLILFTTLMDFNLGLYIDKNEDPVKRKRAVVMSVVMNLGFLAIFKYFNFFADSFADMIRAFGMTPSWTTLKIILPVGISFYTFQSLSYTVDVYWRKIKVEHDFIKFAAFVSLFPQLMAGPIVRAYDLLPQMQTDKSFDWNRWNSGLGRVLWGLFKKVAIADSVGVFADQIFQAPETFSSMHLLIGVIFYSIQIYCDFSGYSDMAIGLARMMGFTFPENFKSPYFSKSFSEFWSRWHISLSSWLRDYLYIPLGGNRNGVANTYKNNMITMLLGGLWHGANWAFVFWGFLHGVYLILQRVCSPVWGRFVRLVRMPSLVENGILIIMVYSLTCLAWIYFRAGSLGHDSFGVANKVITGILSFENFNFGSVTNKFQVVKGMFLIATLVIVELTNYRFQWNVLQTTRPAWRMLSFAILVWLVAFFGNFGANAFIYFQF